MKSALGKWTDADGAAALFGRSVWGEVSTRALLLDLDGTIVGLTQGMADVLGGPVADLQGTSLWKRMLPENRTGLEEAFRRVVRSGEVRTCEFSHKGARHRSVLRPCLGERGEVLGVSAMTADEGENLRVPADHRPSAAVLADTEAQDLTRVEQSEQRLRLSEARRELALEAAQAGSWEWELATNRNVWSDALWGLYGLAPHGCEPSYESWRQAIHPEDRATVERELHEIVRAEGELYLEWRVVDPVAGERWLMSRGRPLRDPAGRVTHYLGVVMDITVRKRAEQSLRERNADLDRQVSARTAELAAERERLHRAVQMLETAATAGKVVLGEVDVGTGRVECSANVDTILGLPAGGFQRSFAAWEQVIHPEDTGRVRGQLERLMEGAPLFDIEYRVRRQDGSYAWWHGVARSERDEEGRVRKIAGAAADVTERRRLEASLRESEQRLRKIYETSADAIGLFDVHGQIVMMNPAAAATFGYGTPEEMVGRSALEFVPPGERERMTQVIRRILETGQQRNVEFPLLRKDGTVFTSEFSSSALYSEDGTPSGMVAVTRDITERKRTEVALHESHRTQASILEAMAEGVVFQGADSTISKCNASAERILGLSHDQILGRTSMDPRWQAIHEDGSAFPGQEHPATVSLQTGQACRDVVMGLNLPDGSQRWICINTQPLFKPGEERPHAVISTFGDITARRRVESLYRLLIQRMFLGFARCEMIYKAGEPTDFVYLEVNAAFEKLTGLKNVTGRRVSEVIPGILEDHPELLETYGRVVRTGEAERFEICLKSQASLWLAIDVYRPEPRHFIAIFENITGRKRKEAALRASEEKHRLLFEKAGDVVLVISPGHRILAANEEACSQLGYTRAELECRTIPEIVPKEIAGLLPTIVEEVEAKRGLIHEAAFVRRDGSVMPVENHSHLVEWNGAKACLVVCRDLTERKRAEERLRQSQKMEAIGHLAGGMAHEFNSLLAGMMMNLDLAKMGCRESEQLMLLADVEDGCERSAVLIKELLAFSRQSVMHRQALDLAEVLKAQAGTLRPVLGERVEWDVVAPEGLPRARADRALVEQVLMNLCLNARDAMKGGGRIRLEAGLERVGAERARIHAEARAGDYLCLAVSDTGCGMDERTMRRLFEPFFTTKDVGQGPGLGLATVRGIVQQHQGWVEVDSKVGTGSTFRVYLPPADPVRPAITP